MNLAKYAIVLFMFTFTAGCTNTHRMLVLYESDQAVRGNLQIIEKESMSTNVQEKENENSSEDESGIIDSLRNQLP